MDPTMLFGKSRWKFTSNLSKKRSWKHVGSGWSPPKTVDEDVDNMIKPESAWTTYEVQILNYNWKALNAIFMSNDINMFSLITNYASSMMHGRSFISILKDQKECKKPNSGY